MALIDERGRVLGRVNLIDAGVGVLVIALATGVYVGYRLLRLPAAPVVVKVEPEVQPGGDGRRLALRGRNFLPFMRVFIQRAGNSATAIHELHPEQATARIDQYTLVNGTQAQLFVESPQVAEVRLPKEMGVGVYDLVFYNETQQVGLKEAAFRLTEPPPPPPPPPSAPRASVRVYGAFVAIDSAHPPRLEAGQALPSGQAESWAHVLEVQPPRPETALVRSPTSDFPARVEGRMQVPAVLRLKCVVTGLLCNTPGGNVSVGNPFSIQVGDRTLQFIVDDMGPDAVEVVRQAIVEVRFFTKVEIANLVRPNDTDRSKLPANSRYRRAAVLQSRGAANEFQSTVGLALAENAQSLQIQDKGVAFNAKLSMPLMELPTGWYYRGQPIKAGANIQFETVDYTVRGMVLGMTLSHAKAPNRSATP